MKIICIGRNYTEHIKELNNKETKEPVVFLKPDTALLPKKHPFYIPEFATNLQHEVEIVVKINRVGKYIDKKFAHKYYDEIGLGIDFTARDLQNKLKKEGFPWEKSKAFDHSAVIGGFLSKKNVSSIDNINFALKNNGKLVQQGNTSQMIWNINEVISYVSQFFTLKIGDLIFTGTPKGVNTVKEHDILEGFLEDKLMFKLHIK